MVYIAKRFNIGVMLCLILMVTYMVRVNLPINIIAMKDDGTCECNYSSQTEANLLAAYFYGYMFTPLPGGLLAQRFGGRRVAGYSCMIATVLTPLTAIVGRCNPIAIFIIRFLVGFVGRFNIAVMLFMVCLISYMMRVNLSINIIAMSKSTSNKTETLEDHGPRYDFSQDDQALLLGAFFYGYLCTSLPAGMLAERFGGKPVAGYSMALSVILTALTPLAASMGVWPVFINRFALGFFGGFVFPCCQNLISKWAPPTEKGKFVATLMGGTFGTVITWPISGIIIENMGWDWAFYMVAIFVGIVTTAWFVIVEDTPLHHKTITPEERDLILKSHGDSVSTKKKLPPFKQLALSTPFLALLLLHYGSMWGLFFLITAAPKFMSEVLGFKLSSAGFLSSLPHLARLVCAFGFGAIADYIRRKDWLSVTSIRKYFCIFSHILPGLFLVVLAFFGKEPYPCVAIMTLSLGFNGAATVTNLANSQDLAPNYAATLYGVMNFLGTTPGFFSPMIVAFFTKDQNTLKEWQNIFLIGAAAYIIPAVVFFFFGSGNIQKWNEIKEDTN